MPEISESALLAKTFKTLILILLVVAVSCGGDDRATLRVLAAASLTEAFNDVAKAFEAKYPGVEVSLDFGGSQRLRSQLEFGAKADVFASADHVQMELVAEAGLTEGGVEDFASNSLVIIAVPDGQVDELSDLAHPGVRLALAHEGVPVGRYSRQVLGKLAEDGFLGLGIGFQASVLANLVSEEANVRNVSQKIGLGEVDAGIVYQTDVVAAQAVGDVWVIPIPATVNVSTRYPITVLQDAPESEFAQAFIRFVLSETGQRLLKEHGFGSP